MHHIVASIVGHDIRTDPTRYSQRAEIIPLSEPTRQMKTAGVAMPKVQTLPYSSTQWGLAGVYRSQIMRW